MPHPWQFHGWAAMRDIGSTTVAAKLPLKGTLSIAFYFAGAVAFAQTNPPATNAPAASTNPPAAARPVASPWEKVLSFLPAPDQDRVIAVRV